MNMRLAPFLSIVLAQISAWAVDPPFPGAGGNYGGTIEASATGDPNNSGILTVVMNDRGSSSLTLVWQGQTYKLKGVFAGDSTAGQFNKDIPKKTPTTEGTMLTLNCNLDPNTRTITGAISDPEASSGGGFSLDGNVADLALLAQLPAGLRMAFMDDPVAPAPREGAQLTSNPLPPTTGTGFTVVSLGKGTTTRSNRSVGRLSDDQPYSAGSPLRSRSYALRSGLYPGKRGQPAGGQLLGNSNASTTALSEKGGAPRSFASLVAALRWHKVPKDASIPYKNGFDGRVNLDTISYDPNRDLRLVLTGQALNYSNASMTLSGGNMVDPITVKMNITFLGARIVGANPNNVRISTQPLKAQFTGSFVHPVTFARVPFHGAFQRATGFAPNIVPGEGRGSFLSLDRNDPTNSQSGKVHIPPPQ